MFPETKLWPAPADLLETAAAPASEVSGPPKRIGRYEVRSTLGAGSFGRVYRAYDEDLNRFVAIKVPRPERVSRAHDILAYLAEARAAAALDHPHIVTVYDVGRTDDGLCYVVSRLIDGQDLATLLESAFRTRGRRRSSP